MLSTAPTSIGANVIAMGFGLIKDKIIPQNLQFTKLKTVDFRECVKDTQKLISKNAIVCANETNTVLCDYDLGDPLVSTDTGKLIGIAIISDKNCQLGHPQGFTGISAYAEWIDGVIEGVIGQK